MEARREAGRDSRLENGAGFVDVECALLTEDIDPPRERGAGVEHRAADQIDIAVPMLVELRWNDMRAQECRLPGERARHLQRPGFIDDGQPVAALALECGDSTTDELIRQPIHPAGQCRVVCGPRRGDSGRDATRGIRLAAHPGRELRGALTREDQMCVTVHESRNHTRSPEIRAQVGFGCMRSSPDPPDAIAVDDDGAVLDDAEGAPVALARIVRDEFTDSAVQDCHRACSLAGASIRSEIALVSRAAGSSTPRCRRSATTMRPSTITSVTSAAEGAETTGLAGGLPPPGGQ